MPAIIPGHSHPLLQSLPSTTLLPTELLELLNHTYFLHLLANEPDKVLPPGKSLISMMSAPPTSHTDRGNPSLQENVEKVIHKAFWDEAIDALSSPQPSVQLPRLKLLYGDLYVALQPLLPASHVVLVTLSAPLSPTSAPLLSALNQVRAILATLRERCAPARDASIDTIAARLADGPPSPRLFVEAVREIIQLAETLRDDLSQFVVGTMGEQQLRAAVRAQARTQEHALVLDVWKAGVVEQMTVDWLSELTQPYAHVEVPAGRKWVVRLVQALGAPTAVACPLPTKPLPIQNGSAPGSPPPPVPNALPPPFFFSTPEAQYVQNFLQAIIITAALRALLPAQPPLPSSLPSLPNKPTNAYTTLTRRVWALLLSSVNDEPDAASTKIANLADELVGAAPPGTDTERLRGAVARTLQVTDPVFVLLQKRLLVAIASRLAASASPLPRVTPGEIRTGKDKAGKRTLLTTGAEDQAHGDEKEAREELVVKGFEEPVLVEALSEALQRLRVVVRWVESGWKDVLEAKAD
ncbi:hypothetical protein FA95DRAFT_351628 [Auriscalpium vulgare]|uniref:Uncharacterized protein n=1 Tax=Auriscalpium vulgare TaxID=40419 RepID=A0ACB8S4B5_9AGAM|nr:hypothetical protein FA95DRAFT_351628 [Auriscalpium vulgare]